MHYIALQYYAQNIIIAVQARIPMITFFIILLFSSLKFCQKVRHLLTPYRST